MTDKQLKDCAIGVRRGILGTEMSTWMCYAVAGPLGGALQRHGIELKFVEVEFKLPWRDVICGHCFLELADGRILDPTADQFSHVELKLPQVYLGKMPAVYEEWIKAVKEMGVR